MKLYTSYDPSKRRHGAVKNKYTGSLKALLIKIRTGRGGYCTSTTATAAQIPRITPKLSFSHVSMVVLQPYRREQERGGGGTCREMNDYRITAGHELSLLKAQLLALG